MNLEIVITFGIVVSTLIFIFFLNNRRINESQINEMINNFFENENFEIVYIRELSLREKIYYNELSFLRKLFTFGSDLLFSSSIIKLYRVVETKDTNGNETQKFIELIFVNETLDEIIVFDSYDL